MDNEIKASDRALAQETRRELHVAMSHYYGQQVIVARHDAERAMYALADDDDVRDKARADALHVEAQRKLHHLAEMVDRRITHEQLALVTS